MAWRRKAALHSQWYPHYSLIHRANPQVLAPHEQRSNEYSLRQHARESAMVKFRHASRRSHVHLFSTERNGLNLAVRQALLFAESFRRAGVPMFHALLKRSHPQIGLIARKSLNVQMI